MAAHEMVPGVYTDLNLYHPPAQEEGPEGPKRFEASDDLLGHVPAPNAVAGLGPASPVVKKKGDVFDGEDKDASLFRGGTKVGIDATWSKYANQEGTRFTEVNTNYFRSDEEKAAHEVSVEDGLLHTADGQLMDTSAATGIGTAHRGARGKHIYTISEDDKVRAADPWAEHTETPI